MKPYKSKRDIPLSDWKEAIHQVTALKNNYTTLLGFLYEIKDINLTDSHHFTVQISFISDCEIFKVHFPSFPMTPGFCLIEISKELLEKYLKTNVSLLEVKNIQIHTTISPINYPTVFFCFVKEENDENKLNKEAQESEK
ncbi:MAG: hypothetical protein LBU51_01515, partial [Bacteroidales bacterium]|nr:hypothetical protein [Bacteroidales bacterium]